MKRFPLAVSLRSFWMAAVGTLGGALLSFASPLEVYDLRIDNLSEPLGIDSGRTYLSWKLSSDERWAQQTAYEVLVASSPEKLAADEGDIWSTGKQVSSDQVQIRYRGAGPDSGEAAYWKVRVWNEEDAVSSWSDVATWTAGFKSEKEWTADWIAHPQWLEVARPHLGYRSLPADDVNTPKWIQLDLGTIHPLDTIKLRAVRHTVAERVGFPTQFKLLAANSPDFADAFVVADSTQAPLNIWLPSHTYELDGVRARFVRLEVPVLRELNGEICLALSQIEIYAGGKNIAPMAKVTASDSLETEDWSLAAINDAMGVPGTNPLANKTALARGEFTVGPELERAVLFVTGLGSYTLELNGTRVGDQRLSPGWTDPEETILYDTFDVTELLQPGANALGMTLASGFHSVSDPSGRYIKLMGRFRPLMGIAQLKLTYADGTEETVTTDASWRTTLGPVTYAHMYGGEDYDARLEPTGWTLPGFDDSEWVPVTTVDGPGGHLRGTSHAAPPLKAFDTLEPVARTPLREGVEIVDLGQNVSLMPHLVASGPAGSRVRISPAELLGEDGDIDRLSSGHNKPAWWELTLDGSGAIDWEPSFFYHGSRYFRVERFPAEEGGALPEVISLTARVVHSSTPAVGTFASSSELFNQIHELIRWAQRSNMVSVLTDCPHRERLGWLEQYHLHGPSLRFEWDMNRLYGKTFNDMRDAQTKDGLIPNVAPEYVTFEGAFRDSPEWGSALIIAAWQQYLFTGDDSFFHTHYNSMQDYFEYLASMADGHILRHGLGDWYDIGPKHPGFSQLTPEGLTATAIYYENARILGEIAAYRTRWGEAAAYRERAKRIKDAFNAEFFDPSTGSYGSGSQTSNAMPYALGMVPAGREADVLAAIVENIESQGNALTSGDVGHRYLLQALAMGGRSDVIYAMHHQSERPGYGYQIKRGATSLTEAWNANRRSSHNHFMLGHIMEWFYRHLVGISPDPTQPGFAHVKIAPEPVGDLTWAEATYDSVRGPISVRWERGESGFSLDVTLPANVTATVALPVGEGDAVEESEGFEAVEFVGKEGHRALFSVGSGTYHFTSKAKLP